VSKSIGEFKGKAGTIYVEKAGYDDSEPYEVWFEDFCIIGTGDSQIAALNDAARHLADMAEIVSDALRQMSPTLTKEEADLVVGAIPLQALPDATPAASGE
jgi:hypothetical protein